VARLEEPVRFEAELGGDVVPIEVTGGDGRYRVAVGGQVTDVDGRQVGEGIWSLLIDGVSSVADVRDQDGVSIVEVDGERYRIRVEEETRYVLRARGSRGAAAGQVVKAPMPGKVVHVAVTVGQAVAAGDPLVVLEAMKMENEFRATVAGSVKEVRVRAGQAVNPGDTLVVIE
jgi:biotin carboxyl carrier protein